MQKKRKKTPRLIHKKHVSTEGQREHGVKKLKDFPKELIGSKK